MSGIIKTTLAGATLFGAYSVYCMKTGNRNYYKNFIMPAMKHLPEEESHKLAVLGFKWKLFGQGDYTDPENLNTKFLEFTLKNPVGIAAGFDKHCEAVEGLEQAGFGFVEVGSVTPEPQPGNEKPRVFRLLEDKGLINRYGFNSDGLEAVYQRLHSLKGDKKFSGVLGVNLGKNKSTEVAIEDYKRGIQSVGTVCDYLVINISSPNTPGLRSMQSKRELEDLLKAAVEERNKLPKPIPLLLKISPDLNESELKDIANVIQKKQTKIDALIISNTTISRDMGLKSEKASEVGGLSGAPLKDLSTKVISQMYKLTKGQVPIIGVGGISTGKDAYEKILAGASVVQIYTAMIHEGPIVVQKIKSELSELLKNDNFNNISEAVGRGPRK